MEKQVEKTLSTNTNGVCPVRYLADAAFKSDT